jgi:hypothetical protein
MPSWIMVVTSTTVTTIVTGVAGVPLAATPPYC